jgi:flagellar export protein FliJ
MKKFKFTLQTVHNVREMREEKEKLVLSELQTEAERIAHQIEHIEKLRFESIENYARRLSAGEQISAMEMELNSNHFASLNRLQQETEKLLEQKKGACSAQRAKLAAAAREVQITERLREHQAKRHRLQLEQYEQTAIDEMVSANFARKIAQIK